MQKVESIKRGLKLYQIILVGCDDATEVKLYINKYERAFLKRLKAVVSKTSTSQCMPTLAFREVKNATKPRKEKTDAGNTESC